MWSQFKLAVKRNDFEHNEQVAVIDWFRMQYPKYANHLFAQLNGGQRHAVVAKKLKAEGSLAGVPDLQLLLARRGKHGLFIEMKKSKSALTGNTKGTVQDSQKAFQAMAIAEGYESAICYGFDEARKVICQYLTT